MISLRYYSGCRHVQGMDHEVGHGSTLNFCCALNGNVQVMADPRLQPCRLGLQ
jgi:hypothetical protein